MSTLKSTRASRRSRRSALSATMETRRTLARFLAKIRLSNAGNRIDSKILRRRDLHLVVVHCPRRNKYRKLLNCCSSFFHRKVCGKQHREYPRPNSKTVKMRKKTRWKTLFRKENWRETTQSSQESGHAARLRWGTGEIRSFRMCNETQKSEYICADWKLFTWFSVFGRCKTLTLTLSRFAILFSSRAFLSLVTDLVLTSLLSHPLKLTSTLTCILITSMSNDILLH